MIQKCLVRREMAKKIRRKMAVFGWSGGFNLKNQKKRGGGIKTQLLSGIIFIISFKIKPVNQIYPNVSDPPLPPPFGQSFGEILSF